MILNFPVGLANRVHSIFKFFMFVEIYQKVFIFTFGTSFYNIRFFYKTLFEMFLHNFQSQTSSMNISKKKKFTTR